MASSVKLSNAFSGSCRIPRRTKWPRPTAASRTPSSTKRPSARRTVARLTPNCSQKLRSGGNRSPIDSCPLLIASPIASYTWR